jgi:hypothetical protein
MPAPAVADDGASGPVVALGAHADGPVCQDRLRDVFVWVMGASGDRGLWGADAWR